MRKANRLVGEFGWNRPFRRVLQEARPLGRFLGYVWRDFPLVRLVLLLTLVLLVLEYAVFSLMIPLAAGDGAVQRTGGSAAVVRLWEAAADALALPRSRLTWLWFFLVLLAARITLTYVHVLLSTWVSKRVHSRLSERTFRRVLIEEPMTEIYRRSIGYYITLAGDDTFRAGTIVNNTAVALGTLTSVLAGFVLLYLFSASILAWTLVFLVVCAALVGAAFSALLVANATSVRMSSQARTTFIEALNGLRSIRSMAAERFVLYTYSEQIHNYVRLLFKIEVLRNGARFLPAVLALLAGAAALWPGSASGQSLTAAYFFAATTLLVRLFISLGALVNSSSILLSDVRAATDIEAMAAGDVGPRPRDADGAGDIAIRSLGLNKVSYGYLPGKDVLRNLTVTLCAGETVAIVGASGCGKSTLADLLLGLVSPREGTVEVNNATALPAQLRSQMVLVEQQARVFSTNVRENLLLGSLHDDLVLWQALHEVDLERYVRELPQGLDAHFDYQGANLSGGQRQRLGIARALIRQPKVLILDEATSALDIETRETVIANLRRVMRDGILIFITHDPVVARAANRVIDLGDPVHATEREAEITA
jgi:ABC-type bacteriocin/lantibiotic exporter with double-glycine peptidase domain